MDEKLKEKLAALRDSKPDLAVAIGCYALVAKGVKLSDGQLPVFGKMSEEGLARMLAAVETELAKV